MTLLSSLIAISCILAMCGDAYPSDSANSDTEICAEVFEILTNTDDKNPNGTRRDPIPALCEYMKLNQNSIESVRCILTKAVKSGTPAGVYEVYQFLPNLAYRCDVPKADVLSAVASVIEVEPGVKRNLLTSLLRAMEDELDKEEALTLYANELPNEVEDLDSASVLLRFILGRHRSFGLTRLSNHLEHRGALSDEDLANASLIDDAIKYYEHSLVSGEVFDKEEGMSLLTDWAGSSVWLKRLYVLEGTKKFPEIIGIQKLEEMSQDPNRIVCESAAESLTKLREIE